MSPSYHVAIQRASVESLLVSFSPYRHIKYGYILTFIVIDVNWDIRMPVDEEITVWIHRNKVTLKVLCLLKESVIYKRNLHTLSGAIASTSREGEGIDTWLIVNTT